MAPSKNAPSLIWAKLSSFLFLLLLHLGCFVFAAAAIKRRRVDGDEKTDTKNTIRKKAKLVSSSTWSFIKGVITAASSKYQSCKSASQTHPSTPPRSSQHSAAILPPSSPEKPDPAPKAVSRRRPSLTESEIDDNRALFFPLRNDIFPCTLCGEIFQKPQSLEAHQATKHAVSELVDDGGDSGKNIVVIIFKTGWRSSNYATATTPTIHRILKIHNGSRILSRFEEYREAVKAKAALQGVGGRRRDERCIADGNELLRFHCSTFLCDLGQNGSSGLCSHQYCSICGIIKSGFSAKLDGIPTLSSSWRAHAAIPEDLEEEFGFMNVRRAMLVCRVVAGRVGTEADDGAEKDGGGFDSVLGRCGERTDEEELVVFNPRAVLPCFVIVYTV